MSPVASDIIRVAQCGLGQWGPNLLRNLEQNPGCRVAAVCDLDEARAREAAGRTPGCRVYTSIDDLAADPDIQAVVLATPAGLHPAQTRLLLDAGKDVLVEKPLSMDVATGAQLVRHARALGRILMVGHTFLFNPAVRRVKEEIDRGTLGRLQFIQAQRMSLGRIRNDCNALWNLAPHDVSILLHWLGAMPVSVSARGTAFHPGHPHEDIALCHLEFPGPIVASITVSWLNPLKIRQMTVVGTQRMLVYDDVRTDAPLTLFHQRAEEVPLRDPEGSFERFQLHVKAGKSESLEVPRLEPLALEIDHFLQSVRSRTEPLGSGGEALRITSVLEACDRSMKQGGVSLAPEKV